MEVVFSNPFTPGAGHQPPYLAGREDERTEFMGLLEQRTILDNVIITGLRGAGKTVLLDSLIPAAVDAGWYWVGTDLSESASFSEANLVTRIFTDLAAITSDVVIDSQITPPMSFTGIADTQTIDEKLSSQTLQLIYDSIPGLASDKLKDTLKYVWKSLEKNGKHGIIFAYDEAETLANNPSKDQYPLSLLLDVFQSLQKSGFPLMLALTGLPTLFPKLVDARTYAQRMFHIISLESLSESETKKAILKPIESQDCPVKLNEESVATVYKMSGGYPYFIQFICRETYKTFIQQHQTNQTMLVPVEEILNKLDQSFFAGRWQRLTDRQRDLMIVAAHIKKTEFSVQEILKTSESLEKRFAGGSQVNQMLSKLIDQGIVFKNRHGRYSFAVPLLDQFIRRQNNLEEY